MEKQVIKEKIIVELSATNQKLEILDFQHHFRSVGRLDDVVLGRLGPYCATHGGFPCGG
eukprot:jgi/Pico_ML_1/52798/g3452.t1